MVTELLSMESTKQLFYNPKKVINQFGCTILITKDNIRMVINLQLPMKILILLGVNTVF